MYMQLQAIDELGNIEKEFGLIEQEKIEELIIAANALKLDCLSGLDVAGDTYFNDKQCRHIQNELSILGESKKIEDSVLSIIQNGIDFVAHEDSYLFLKFIGQ